MANSGLIVRMEGLPQALKALDQFSAGVQRHQALVAINAGAGVLKAGAKRRVTRESGTLEKHLIVKTTRTKKNTGVYSRIGARRGVKVAVYEGKNGLKQVASIRRKKDGTLAITGEKRLRRMFAQGLRGSIRSPSRYAHLVEHGTQAHTVSVKNKKVLARSGEVFGTSVRIKARPMPFLEPTARVDGPAAVLRSKDKLKQGIESERRKAMARSGKPA